MNHRNIHDKLADAKDENKALKMIIGVLLFIIVIMYLHFVFGLRLSDPTCLSSYNCGL